MAADKKQGADTGVEVGPLTDTRPLIRSTVYQRLTLRARAQLDAAILLRPPKHPTLPAIHARFKLHEKYGISLKALSSYAVRLERLVRPAVAAQVVAGILGCLPEAYRRQVYAGSQVLLLSRVLAVLNAERKENEPELSVAELAKLATALSSLARRAGGAKADGARQTELRPAAGEVGEAVRRLYGLNWPAEKTSNDEMTTKRE